jgi:hypothetical protein
MLILMILTLFARLTHVLFALYRKSRALRLALSGTITGTHVLRFGLHRHGWWLVKCFRYYANRTRWAYTSPLLTTIWYFYTGYYMFILYMSLLDTLPILVLYMSLLDTDSYVFVCFFLWCCCWCIYYHIMIIFTLPRKTDIDIVLAWRNVFTLMPPSIL